MRTYPLLKTTNENLFYKPVRLATFAPTFKRNGNNNIIMRKKKKHCLQCEKYIVLHEYNLVVGQKTNLQIPSFSFPILTKNLRRKLVFVKHIYFD